MSSSLGPWSFILYDKGDTDLELYLDPFTELQTLLPALLEPSTVAPGQLKSERSLFEPVFFL